MLKPNIFRKHITNCGVKDAYYDRLLCITILLSNLDHLPRTAQEERVFQNVDSMFKEIITSVLKSSIVDAYMMMSTNAVDVKK